MGYGCDKKNEERLAERKAKQKADEKKTDSKPSIKEHLPVEKRFEDRERAGIESTASLQLGKSLKTEDKI